MNYTQFFIIFMVCFIIVIVFIVSYCFYLTDISVMQHPSCIRLLLAPNMSHWCWQAGFYCETMYLSPRLARTMIAYQKSDYKKRQQSFSAFFFSISGFKCLQGVMVQEGAASESGNMYTNFLSNFSTHAVRSLKSEHGCNYFDWLLH